MNKKLFIRIKSTKIEHFVRMMCILVPFLVFSVTIQGQITVNEKNQTIKQVLKTIESKSNYKFFYNAKFTDLDRKVTIDVANQPIESVLEILLSNTQLNYEKKDNNQIVLVLKPENMATNRDWIPKHVAIIVTDEEGNSIVGASVVEKGTTNGTVTDLNGVAAIDAGYNAVLQVFYLGYITQEIGLKGIKEGTSIDVRLAEDTQKLDEVVVVGYGTQKRVNLTGAVSSVSSEVVQSKPVNNPLSALQGEIPGLLIQRYSGSPGNEVYNMNVRGASSTNGENNPLIIIDGIAGDINLLNPDDIESISILKDAQAAIYGARAAGGVFLVTTKKGKSGTPRISYNGNFAVTHNSGLMKSPNTYEMAIMDNEANIHNGASPMYTPDMLKKILNNDPNPVDHPLYGGWKLFFTTTDWMKELLENGFLQKHNLSISGGGENSNYYLSGGYTDQRGVVRYADDNSKRYSLRFNYDYTFWKRVRLETKVVMENQMRTGIGGVGDWVIGEGIFDMPNTPVYTYEGNFFAQGGWSNAVAMAKEGSTATFKIRNVNTNFKLIADIVTGLQLNLQAGINYKSTNDKDPARAVPLYNWDEGIAYYAITNPGESNLTESNSENMYRNFTGYLQFSRLFAGKHNVDIMAGLAHEENDFEKFNAWRDGFSDNGLWELNLGSSSNMWNEGRGDHWSIHSAFGRAGYSFDNKYLLEANFRYDGSSRFSGAEKRWGFFPGISLGWRLSEELFLKNTNLFDDLKIRVSYGTTGNQEGIGLYDFIQKIKVRDDGGGTTVYYPFGTGNLTKSVYLDGMVARNRTWETIINKNIGLDATILNHRLNLSLDYFIKDNTNMLIPVTYPSLMGAIAPSSNSGEMETKGFEISAGWRDKIGNVSYFVKAMLSDAKNKIIKFGGADTYVLGLNEVRDGNVREGYPMNSYFAYEFDGLIWTQDELDEYKKLEGVPSNISIGDARFKDLNHDGKISAYGDTDDGDVKYVGTIDPRYTYGVTLGGKYKGFDASIFFQGVGKRTLFRTGEYAMPWSDWWRQPPQFYYNQTWNEDRSDAYYPRLSHGDIRYWNYQESTLQQINAAYIRLKNVQVGYSLPSGLVRRIHISNARIYLSGQDIWEHHNVKGGWDPESAAWGGNYPFQRYYSFGLDITF